VRKIVEYDQPMKKTRFVDYDDRIHQEVPKEKVYVKRIVHPDPHLAQPALEESFYNDEPEKVGPPRIVELNIPPRNSTDNLDPSNRSGRKGDSILHKMMCNRV
jgi:hypothetical protein